MEELLLGVPAVTLAGEAQVVCRWCMVQVVCRRGEGGVQVVQVWCR